MTELYVWLIASLVVIMFDYIRNSLLTLKALNDIINDLLKIKPIHFNFLHTKILKIQ